MASFASSYQPSFGAGVERNADILPFPFLARPQAMTVYVRFVELGTIFIINGRIVEITSKGTTNPRFILLTNGTNYRCRHETGFGSVIANATAAPSIGDIVELVGQLNTDGSVVLIQSINDLEPTKTAASSALNLAAAWSGQLVWIGTDGGVETGFAGFRNVVIHRGVQTIETMRRMAGVI